MSKHQRPKKNKNMNKQFNPPWIPLRNFNRDLFREEILNRINGDSGFTKIIVSNLRRSIKNLAKDIVGEPVLEPNAYDVPPLQELNEVFGDEAELAMLRKVLGDILSHEKSIPENLCPSKRRIRFVQYVGLCGLVKLPYAKIESFGFFEDEFK